MRGALLFTMLSLVPSIALGQTGGSLGEDVPPPPPEAYGPASPDPVYAPAPLYSPVDAPAPDAPFAPPRRGPRPPRFGRSFGMGYYGTLLGGGVTALATGLTALECRWDCDTPVYATLFISAFIAVPLATGFFSWLGAGHQGGVERAFFAALVEVMYLGFASLVGLVVGAATGAPPDASMAAGLGLSAPLTPLAPAIFQISE